MSFPKSKGLIKIAYFCTKINTKFGSLNPFADPENPDLLKLNNLNPTGARLIGVMDSKLLKFIVVDGWLKLKPCFLVAIWIVVVIFISD